MSLFSLWPHPPPPILVAWHWGARKHHKGIMKHRMLGSYHCALWCHQSTPLWLVGSALATDQTDSGAARHLDQTQACRPSSNLPLYGDVLFIGEVGWPSLSAHSCASAAQTASRMIGKQKTKTFLGKMRRDSGALNAWCSINRLNRGRVTSNLGKSAHLALLKSDDSLFVTWELVQKLPMVCVSLGLHFSFATTCSRH